MAHDPRQLSVLLAQIAKDIEAATSLAQAAAAAARNDAQAGRLQPALQHILTAEPEIFEAGKLVQVATYVGALDTHRDEEA